MLLLGDSCNQAAAAYLPLGCNRCLAASLLCSAACSAAAEGSKPKVDAVQLEEEALARIQAAVAERYAAAIAGQEVRLDG